MASSTNQLPMLSAGQAGKEISINAAVAAASPAMLFARDELSCIGLTMRVFGGWFRGIELAAQSITLTASATNYVEADPVTGVISSNTASFTAGRLSLYTVTTGAATQTAWTDHRQSLFASGSGGGAQLDAVNVFTKAQGVSPVKVAAATGALALDLSQSNIFRLTLTGNVTLSVSGAGDGFVYTVQLTQDATGGRTMAWPAKFRWPGGVPAALSTAADAVDLLSAIYDADADRYDVVLNKAFV